MSNFDMTKILSMLGKMDKKDLEAGIAKANEILKSQGIQTEEKKEE